MSHIRRGNPEMKRRQHFFKQLHTGVVRTGVVRTGVVRTGVVCTANWEIFVV